MTLKNALFARCFVNPLAINHYREQTFSIDRPGTRVFRKRESIDVLKAYRNQVSTQNFNFSLLLYSNTMSIADTHSYYHKY